MGIFRKLFTLGKGVATEAGQAVVDANALKILDQEIRDAEAALGKAKDALSELMAKRRVAQDKAQGLDAQIDEYKAKAKALLAKGDEALAREVAQRISHLMAEKTAQDQIVTEFAASETGLRETIRQTGTKIETLKREVETVRATEATQRAQAAVAAKHSGVNSSLGSAADSLARIRQRQVEQSARFKAAGELAAEASGADLDAKLAAAGVSGPVGSNADDILASLR